MRTFLVGLAVVLLGGSAQNTHLSTVQKVHLSKADGGDRYPCIQIFHKKYCSVDRLDYGT